MNREQIEALDTPETDAAIYTDDYGDEYIELYHARSLERRYKALKIAVETGIMALELRGNHKTASEILATLDACREIERE